MTSITLHPRDTLRRRLAEANWFLLVLPALAFLSIFFLYPLIDIVMRSLNGGSTNYERIFSTSLYIRVVATTFEMGLLVTAACLVIGYAYAYALSATNGSLLAFLTVALLLPFWVSVLLRTFAWLVLLQNTGLINSALVGLGIIDTPVQLLRNKFGIAVGMVNILLPYMVLPLLSVMKGIDPRLIAAARISGASYLRCFFRIYLPLTVPGIISGSVLVMTLSLGFYIVPAVLGGGRDTMIAQLIADQITKQVNFNFSSALAVTLIIFTALVFTLFGLSLRMAKKRTAGD